VLGIVQSVSTMQKVPGKIAESPSMPNKDHPMTQSPPSDLRDSNARDNSTSGKSLPQSKPAMHQNAPVRKLFTGMHQSTKTHKKLVTDSLPTSPNPTAQIRYNPYFRTSNKLQMPTPSKPYNPMALDKRSF
jgi:hypothetical protein